ncbi:MAG: phosphate transport system substrate-binding protein [Erysipelotrichaceae bacterium]|nr:MAG: phosphate transport system substrate-binding [Erysipelotrichaceae bacterium]TXT17800.1 MAG: phosphate transport system substrate-binding protein [Erysipelotrichaceae bacterium]
MKPVKTTPPRRAHFVSKFKIILLVFMTSLSSGCNRKNVNGLILAGSTSVQPFAETLAEAYMKLHSEISIDVQGGGSSAGVMSAQTNTADIGMSSRSLKDKEKTLWSVEIARDGLAIIINPKNTITSLTLNQVRDIYSGVITNWSQLGGKDKDIHVITREEGSGTRSAFEDLLMDDIEIDPHSIVQDSNGTVRQLVGDDANAIGYISLGLVNEKVKALELDGVAATRENVLNGTYVLSRPYLFVTSSEPVGEVKKFIDFVLSADGRALLDLEGLITYDSGGSQ